MSLRTIIAIVITITLTVLIIQNTDEVIFTVFSVKTYLPKVAVLTATSVGGFLLGILVSRPRRKKYTGPSGSSEGDDQQNNRLDTLSDEDRNYIS
ncbi:hypothetical protein [Mucilaginibacter lacusdianchii]|uniref:hypothetical protein n=1 Tax=Mucilaginibacter lacusdianchii TaxID=2684211 RepID=UPI00131C01EE|nr:hypothetical protein [Mucilaginibacter sp. JXJ CY 39]